MYSFDKSLFGGPNVCTHLGELAFKVKSSTVFSRIVNAYCKNKGISPKSVRFHDDGGHRINIEQTVAEV